MLPIIVCSQGMGMMGKAQSLVDSVENFVDEATAEALVRVDGWMEGLARGLVAGEGDGMCGQGGSPQSRQG